MEDLTLHPVKRAKRDYLDESGIHELPERSVKELLLQLLDPSKNQDSEQNDRDNVLNREASLLRKEEVFRAAAELNQLMNVTQLLRLQEYLKLLPVQRTVMEPTAIPLTPFQQRKFHESKFSSATDILSKGVSQSKQAVERRGLYVHKLAQLREHWSFVLSPNTLLFVDTSLPSPPIVNSSTSSSSLFRSLRDPLLPLEITSEGENIIRASGKSSPISLTFCISLLGESMTPIASCQAWADIFSLSHSAASSSDTERECFLHQHSLLSLDLFQFLTSKLLPSDKCSHQVSAALSSLLTTTDSSPPSLEELLPIIFKDSMLSDNTINCLSRAPSAFSLQLSESFVASISLEAAKHEISVLDGCNDFHFSRTLTNAMQEIMGSVYLQYIQLRRVKPSLEVVASVADKLRAPFLRTDITEDDKIASFMMAAFRRSLQYAKLTASMPYLGINFQLWTLSSSSGCLLNASEGSLKVYDCILRETNGSNKLRWRGIGISASSFVVYLSVGALNMIEETVIEKDFCTFEAVKLMLENSI